ncbi:Peptidase acyl-coenzyme A:6-aminopenicillanic acid acyl-transferase [Cordyceps militaris]|uniref:Peptidase acyl-coenzyme A:6-aminopenicillanic acid acyl-transferase n=1 Tax=Cordyceps militaris TaxID=73501 RepID=A0A2H4S6W7_CORMI|nr:Peptidase acyl-coenzyme A:6-aminopenicillanic acid acyl-transferase [Cordyceps militaris]
MFAGFESFSITTETVPAVTIFGRLRRNAGSRLPPILFLHGFPQSHHIWEQVSAQLVSTYTVVLMDLRGYGASSKPGKVQHYAKSAMARDCIRVMDALGLGGGFFVCGHDRGARVAHKLCVDFAARVRRALLLDVCPTLAMYASTDHRLAAAYFHWFFLIQPEPLPEAMISGCARRFGEFCLGIEREQDRAAFGAGCLEYYLAMLESPETVHAMCQDYRASATLDLDEAREDLARGRLVCCPLRVLWAGQGVIETCFDPLREWRAVTADGCHATLVVVTHLASWSCSQVMQRHNGHTSAAPAGESGKHHPTTTSVLCINRKSLELHIAGSSPLRIAIMQGETKIITCAGTSYEIGFAHGSGAAAEIHGNIAIYVDFFQDRAKISWAQARERASAYLPLLSAKYPEILDEMRGIADGAGQGLTMPDILTLNTRSELGLTNVADGCTCLSQQGPDGRIFLAQNWDWLPVHLVVLHIVPATSPLQLQFMSEAGLVGKIGLNSAGVGTLLNGILAGALSTARLPIHVLLRRVLQFAASFAEALAVMDAYGLASTCNIVVADAQGRAASVECSPRGNAVIPLQGEPFPSVGHTNHLYAIDSRFGVVDYPEHNSFTRLARLRELTMLDRENGVPPSFDSIRMRLCDRQGAPYSICLDGPSDQDVGLDRVTTVSTIIMELSRGVVQLTVGRPCDSPPVIEWEMSVE